MNFVLSGTRNSQVKQLYYRSQLNLCEPELISTQEVPYIQTTDVVETAQTFSIGQGLKNSSCKTRCDNKTCACFKNNIQCYSKCHHINHCSNQ